jgi:hypothetical protein
MKANSVAKYLILAFFLVLPLLTGCAKKDTESAERMLTEYWQALFEGDVKTAYSKFSRESRKETSMEDFADRVAFGLESSAQKDSFWVEYSRICKLDMGPVNIRGDTAYADVLLTIPNLARLAKDLELKADSLGIDSHYREDWMMKERTSALAGHNYIRSLCTSNLSFTGTGSAGALYTSKKGGRL